MPCFWHVLCHVCGVFCCVNWEDLVAGGQGLFRDGFGSKFGVYRSCQAALWHAGVWKPCYCMAGLKFSTLGYSIAWVSTQLRSPCILGYTIAWVSTQLRSPCTLLNLQLRTAITPSFELCFGYSWTLWKAL